MLFFVKAYVLRAGTRIAHEEDKAVQTGVGLKC
jgi:hypothetical protein